VVARWEVVSPQAAATRASAVSAVVVQNGCFMGSSISDDAAQPEMDLRRDVAKNGLPLRHAECRDRLPTTVAEGCSASMYGGRPTSPPAGRGT
jgi:hypothetical protein